MYKKLAKISSLAVAMGGRGLYELDKSANAEILLFLCFFLCVRLFRQFFPGTEIFSLSFLSYLYTYISYNFEIFFVLDFQEFKAIFGTRQK